MTVALHVRLSEFIVESRHTEISYQLSRLVRLGSQQAALNIVTELMFQWVFYLIICSPWHDTESLPPSLSQPSISSWNLGGVNVCQRSPGGHFVNDGNYLQPAPQHRYCPDMWGDVTWLTVLEHCLHLHIIKYFYYCTRQLGSWYRHHISSVGTRNSAIKSLIQKQFCVPVYKHH